MKQWKLYKIKPKQVYARQVNEKETVVCYNGVKIAQHGEWVIYDKDDERTMLMKGSKFLAQYIPIQNVDKAT